MLSLRKLMQIPQTHTFYYTPVAPNLLVPCDEVFKSDVKQQEIRGIQLRPECVMTYFRVANSQHPSSKSWP